MLLSIATVSLYMTLNRLRHLYHPRIKTEKSSLSHLTRIKAAYLNQMSQRQRSKQVLSRVSNRLVESVTREQKRFTTSFYKRSQFKTMKYLQL